MSSSKQNSSEQSKLQIYKTKTKPQKTKNKLDSINHYSLLLKLTNQAVDKILIRVTTQGQAKISKMILSLSNAFRL